jgi:isoprenylcysteine carboxyl methyltransferase (ICMT) family protein YpbQ
MIPIIVVENPINISVGLQKSTRLFQDSWGENLVGNISFLLLGSLLFILIFLVSVTMARTHINFINGLHVFIIGIVILHAIMSTLIGIWRTVLYVYVTTRHTVEAFDTINMEKVVKSKN